MSSLEPTRIGSIRHVLGSSITVELDTDLAGVSPIWEGHLQPIGQIGSVVRIPQGPVTLLGTVTMVGISELAGALVPSIVPHLGDRWLQVQLLGEIDGIGRFARGVSCFPGLNDDVHFATNQHLKKVFPAVSEERVRLGCLSASPEVPLTLDAARLVVRHSAVVGSTGSGKTSAVATLLQHLVKDGFAAANVVVIDPHGEYAHALGGISSVTRVMETTPSFCEYLTGRYRPQTFFASQPGLKLQRCSLDSLSSSFRREGGSLMRRSD
jgi:uncharacterized protein